MVAKFQGETLGNLLFRFDGGDPLGCALTLKTEFGDLGVGLSGGELFHIESSYFGPTINRAKALASAASPGQILITPEIKEFCPVPSQVEFKSLGIHTLSDLGPPIEVITLLAPDEEFPPIRSLSTIPNNLPIQEIPFVDRDSELLRLKNYLGDPNHRVVTLIGPGGIGKSRLAFQAAAESACLFPDGIFVVPLAPLAIVSDEIIVFAIAEAVGFSFYSREDPQRQLLSCLKDKHILLILENIEYVKECTPLFSRLIENTNHLKLLITSRERIRLKGATLMVGGLMIPKDLSGPTGGFGSIQLFYLVGKRNRPDFEPTGSDWEEIIKSCRMVDGLPLGIELAASWLRSFTVKQIGYELSRSLDFLKTSVKGRSLRGVFDSSWRFLSSREKEVFRRLSVFHGNITAEAAEAVAGADRSILESLSDRSLLRKLSPHRYLMLDTLRLYAEEKLNREPNGGEMVRSRHSHYFMTYLAQMEGGLKGPEQKEILTKIGKEIENIRAAWQWSVRQLKEAEIEAAVGALGLYYDMRGWYKEAKATFEWTLEELKMEYLKRKRKVKERLWAMVLTQLGIFHQRLASYDKAKKIFHEVIEIFKPLGDKRALAYVINNLGATEFYQGNYDEAVKFYRESLRLREEIGDEWGMAASYNNLAGIAYVRGDYQTAKDLYLKSLEIQRKTGDRRMLASLLNNLGNVSHIQKNYDEANRYYEEALSIFTYLGDRLGMALTYNNLGSVTQALGEVKRAEGYLRKSLQIYEALGDARGKSFALINLGDATFKLKKYTVAKRYLKEALRILVEISAMPYAYEALIIFAQLYETEGKIEAAAELLSFITESKETEASTQKKAAQLLEKLEEKLSKEQLHKMREKVRGLRLERIVREFFSI